MSLNRVYVPIGTSCWPTHMLRKHGLRKSAYPFDWQITPLKSVYELLKNNFDGFMDDLLVGSRIYRWHYVESDNPDNPNMRRSRAKVYSVICKKYNILFPHYFDDVDESTIFRIKKKMEKRITRLINLTKSGADVCLVYSIDGGNDWQRQCYEEQNINLNVLDKDKNREYVTKLKELVGDNVVVSGVYDALKL